MTIFIMVLMESEERVVTWLVRGCEEGDGGCWRWELTAAKKSLTFVERRVRKSWGDEARMS